MPKQSFLSKMGGGQLKGEGFGGSSFQSMMQDPMFQSAFHSTLGGLDPDSQAVVKNFASALNTNYSNLQNMDSERATAASNLSDSVAMRQAKQAAGINPNAKIPATAFGQIGNTAIIMPGSQAAGTAPITNPQGGNLQRAAQQSMFGPPSPRDVAAQGQTMPGGSPQSMFSAAPVQQNQAPPSDPYSSWQAGQTMPGGSPASWFGATPSNGY